MNNDTLKLPKMLQIKLSCLSWNCLNVAILGWLMLFYRDCWQEPKGRFET